MGSTGAARKADGAAQQRGSAGHMIEAYDLVAFVSSSCPFCRRALQAMSDAGLQACVVEVSGPLRGELTSLTGSTSVPQVFAKGKFVGGCNDGGLGGVLPLLRSGKLQDMLSEKRGPSSGPGSVREQVEENELVAFVSRGCPYCSRAVDAMRSAGLHPVVSQATPSMRQDLAALTGSTSVPQVFARGQLVGGCNDGGLGGVLPLLRSGELQALLRGGRRGGAAEGAASVASQIREHELVAFVSRGCPFCARALSALGDAGLAPAVVEVTPAIRDELTSLTGSTSVPQVFARGKFVGGCNDGGLGGVLPLLRGGELQALLGRRGGGRAESAVASQIRGQELVAFVSRSCPFCARALHALRDAGFTPAVVEVTPAIREELTSLTGSTSVPQVFARGKFVGGCNDGGLGGVLPLLKSGQLRALLS